MEAAYGKESGEMMTMRRSSMNMMPQTTSDCAAAASSCANNSILILTGIAAAMSVLLVRISLLPVVSVLVSVLVLLGGERCFGAVNRR